ncbi:MAG: NAD+ synthase [Verrucomicrobiae bacterium]|nr:NAD+ synthase [Verrucomicrobiae bacterium]
MKLALAQLNTTVGDLRGNAAKILDAYRRAAEAGAELVITPELAITGYPPRDLLAKRRFVDDNLRVRDELLPHIGDTALLVGYVDLNPDVFGRPYYNAAALLHRGQIVVRRFKTLLPPYAVFDEDRYFQPAPHNDPVVFGGCRLGITICEDIWNIERFAPVRYPRDPLADFAHAGLRLLVNLSASPYHIGKGRLRHELLRGVARRFHVPLAYCNMVGGNDELVFDGRSLVFDAEGNLLAEGKAFAEDVVVVDLDKCIGGIQPVERDPVANVHDALVLGLRDYAAKCGFKSAVLGLSGGIDSAVVACLAAEAFGAENVLGVSLPSQFSSQSSLDDARQLACNLGIRYEVISIQPAFEQLKTTLRPLFQGLPEDTTEENLQARIRGTLLMAISNKFGHLLLSTGNKSELAVGYCTLYGDMNGGLAVIGDVPKTMVYELARYINRQRVVIPEACLTKPPSAELRPNQTDQDTLPPYDVLDAILKRYIEENKSAAEIIAETGFEERLVRDVIRRIDLNEYKRKQAPPCLRVTTKAFGFGRRVPIAQRYVER